MCGICGVFLPGGGDSAAAVEWARRTSDRMTRRGPDDDGLWTSADQCAVLGFRRLAILDLSPQGHQPMLSADGRSAIVFNGEIYNFPELRAELEQDGVRFRSRSDTEALLEALNRWGVDRVVPRLNGMFAFAWYRIDEREMILARDHAGIKPLSYGWDPATGAVAFASRYDALVNPPWGRGGDPRPDILHLFLRLHHIPAPYALLERTAQLRPGHLLRLRPGHPPEEREWWSLPRCETDRMIRGPEADEAVRAALANAVARQRISDRPLGVFLSGGIDSPLVAAELRRQVGPGVSAFTISSPGWRQDEAPDARRYAEAIDVDLHVREVSGDLARDVLEDVARAQYEPFADFSIVPTLIVSRFAVDQVTVALSGDGGDELFFGYERPMSLLRNAPDLRYPVGLRRWLYRLGRLGIVRHRSDAIVYPTPGDYYFDVNTRIRAADIARIAPGLDPMPGDFSLYRSGPIREPGDLAAFSREVEFGGQLQRGLKKVDMASMYESLEVRVPLLDREVIDTACRIDPFDCMRGGVRKALLRDLLGTYVPPGIIPTSKRGFAVPLGDWLRGPLRGFVEDTLFDAPLFPDGAFDRAAVETDWREHVKGVHDRKWQFWTLLSLQGWARAHGVAAAPARSVA